VCVLVGVCRGFTGVEVTVADGTNSVAEGVSLGTAVDVGVGVDVGVKVPVDVGTSVCVGVSDGTAVAVSVGASVGVAVSVELEVGVLDGLGVNVKVDVAVGVGVAVRVEVRVGVLVRVSVAVGVGVDATTASCQSSSSNPAGFVARMTMLYGLPAGSADGQLTTPSLAMVIPAGPEIRDHMTGPVPSTRLGNGPVYVAPWIVLAASIGVISGFSQISNV
jgi:hypothetical protein